jgi:hypothetical protein
MGNAQQSHKHATQQGYAMQRKAEPKTQKPHPRHDIGSNHHLRHGRHGRHGRQRMLHGGTREPAKQHRHGESPRRTIRRPRTQAENLHTSCIIESAKDPSSDTAGAPNRPKELNGQGTKGRAEESRRWAGIPRSILLYVMMCIFIQYLYKKGLARAPCMGLGCLVWLRFALRSLAMWRVCALAPSFVSC